MRIYCKQQRCSPRSVASGDLSLMQVFVGVRWWAGCQMGVRLSTMRLFSFDHYIFRMKFRTGFTYWNLRGFTRFPGGSTAVVLLSNVILYEFALFIHVIRPTVHCLLHVAAVAVAKHDVNTQEMSGNSAFVGELSGNWLSVREMLEKILSRKLFIINFTFAATPMFSSRIVLMGWICIILLLLSQCHIDETITVTCYWLFFIHTDDLVILGNHGASWNWI